MNNRLFLSSARIRHRLSSLILAILLNYIVCFGQNGGVKAPASLSGSATVVQDTLPLDENQDIGVQLVPFDELLQTAVSHSPYMKYQNEVTNSLDQAQQISKLQILQNVSGYVNYSSGNQTILSSGGAVIPGQDALGQIANGYRIGVEMRLPLYELFGRKHQVQQANSNYKAAVVQKDIIKQQLQRDLINVYQDMLTAQQLVKTHLLDEQASLTALRLAEVDLQRGRLTADAMAIITNRYVQAKVGSDQAQGNFLKSVHFFEALVGVPIQQLKRY